MPTEDDAVALVSTMHGLAGVRWFLQITGAVFSTLFPKPIAMLTTSLPATCPLRLGSSGLDTTLR